MIQYFYVKSVYTMSYSSNPSSLGGGAPGIAPILLGGGGGSKGGSGVEGGQPRAMDRFSLRQAFKTSNINPVPSNGYIAAVCGPFRAATSAGDILGRVQQSAGGANQVNTVRRAANAGWRILAGGVPSNNAGQTITIEGITFTTGLGAGQTQIQSGNPKYVYDGSDFTRYKRLAAKNRNYNDLTFGGPSQANIGGSGEFTALNRVRH